MNSARTRQSVFLLSALATSVLHVSAQLPDTLLHSLFDPGTNNQVGTRFGFRVASDGNIVVVGAPATSLSQHRSGVVSVFALPAGTLTHSLTNPGTANSWSFGSAVSISGSRIVVGSYDDFTSGTNAGVCYVYELSSVTPTVPSMVLTNPVPTSWGYFGISVAISGTRILVGASGESSTAPRTGAAYLYDLDHVTPLVPIAKVRNPSPSAYGSFGSFVAFAGTKGVVGPLRNPGLSSAGTFYYYEMALPVLPGPNETLTSLTPIPLGIGNSLATSGMRVVLGDTTGARVYDISANVASPTPLAVLTNPAAFLRVSSLNGGFGRSVAISGNHVIVGDPAFMDSTNGWDGPSVGRAYAFDLAELIAPHTSLAPALVLTNLHSTYADDFGISITLENSRAVIGMPGADLAYTYDLNSPLPTTALSAFSPAKKNYFGTSVSIDASRAVVGAPGDDGGALDAGAAYVYELETSSGATPALTLANPVPQAGDRYGSSVAISGMRLLVGAPNGGANDSGTVYFYDLTRPLPMIPALDITNPVPQIWADFGTSLAIHGSRVVIGAPTFDHNNSDPSYHYSDAGIAYVYDLSGPTPGLPLGKLISPWGGRFGSAVAISDSHVAVGGIYESGWAGRVYVYDYASQLSTNPAFVLSNPVSGSRWFGRSLVISGTRIVVGGGGDGISPEIGRAYLYDLSSSNASVPSITFVNPEASAYDKFGSSVAIDGTIVLVATVRSVPSIGGGQIYIYDLASGTPSMPVGVLKHPRASPSDHSFEGASGIIGPTVSMGASRVIMGVPLQETIADDRGAAYVFGLLPKLSIGAGTSGFATLSWTPATSSGFVLQHASSLSSDNWFTAPSGPTNPVFIPNTNATGFYRLLQQE